MSLPTKPLTPGAPLDPEVYPAIQAPAGFDVERELCRAQVELMHAIARHRKAWAKAKSLGDDLDAKGTWKDSDLTYGRAIGDVSWWREEMSAQAAAVSALTNMLNGYGPDYRRRG